MDQARPSVSTRGELDIKELLANVSFGTSKNQFSLNVASGKSITFQWKVPEPRILDDKIKDTELSQNEEHKVGCFKNEVVGSRGINIIKTHLNNILTE